MTKRVILILWSVPFLFFLCLNVNSIATAADCEPCGSETPSSPGNTTIPDNFHLNIVARYTNQSASDPNTIASSYPVYLHVESSGYSCPNYTWSIASKGYSLDKTETSSASEEVMMSVVSGSCGKNGSGDYDVVAVVTVTDDCGKSNTIVIRHESGVWKGCLSMGIGGCVCTATRYIYFSYSGISFRYGYDCWQSGRSYSGFHSALPCSACGISSVPIPKGSGCAYDRVCN